MFVGWGECSLPAGRYPWLVAVLIGYKLYRDVFAVGPFVSVPALDLQGFVFGSRVLKNAFLITGDAVTCLESETWTNFIEVVYVHLYIHLIPLSKYKKMADGT